METKKTVLIADDDTNSLRFMLQVFKEAGEKFDILHAPNGKIACDLAQSKNPDLIIMDWNMPIMTGVEAVHTLKKEPKTTDIPIIMVTGVMIDDLNLAEALHLGAADYLRKPISPIELVARVRSTLSLSKAYQEIKELYAREKAYMDNHIAQKMRELTSISVQMAQKNEVLTEIKDKLEALPASSVKRELLHTIENNLYLDSYWDKFKMHFEEVHPDFFTRLKNNFPDISQNEFKLCAYIKMRLGNKEIAQLTGISVKGMETARYRLKKKLNLNAEQDMNDFIQNF
jgi:DNA-binding response OmpR family regulator